MLVTGSAAGMFSPVPHHTASLLLKDGRRSETVLNRGLAQQGRRRPVKRNNAASHLSECQRITAVWADSSPLAEAQVMPVCLWALRNHLTFPQLEAVVIGRCLVFRSCSGAGG